MPNTFLWFSFYVLCLVFSLVSLSLSLSLLIIHLIVPLHRVYVLDGANQLARPSEPDIRDIHAVDDFPQLGTTDDAIFRDAAFVVRGS